MKEFIEKLIGRLEELREKSFSGYTEAFELYREEFWRGRMGGFTNAIEIVNQLAEEYTNSISLTDYDSIIKFIESEIERTSSFAEHDTQINIKFFVEQLKQEHNNGWISCSERLPKHNEFVIASVIPHEGVNGGHPIVITRFDMHASSWYNGIIKAWQPLPAPYQPKGE